MNLLKIRGKLPVISQNAGLFISRGKGIHPTRVINSYELIFVRQGRLGMFEAQRRFELGAGQTLLLWPGRKHGGTIPYPRDLSFYWVHFTLLRPDEADKVVAGSGSGGFRKDSTCVAKATTAEQVVLRHTSRRSRKTKTEAAESFTLSPGTAKSRPALLFSVPQLATLHRPERLTELFRRFLDDQESGHLTPASGACLIIQMLTEVSRGSKNARFLESPSYAFLASRAEDYIRTHFDKPISARDIARILQCNPDYLGRVFRLVFGCTLTERLHQRRILKTKSLLMDSTLNINEIAQACGFNDVVYFRRIFERHCDMTPLAFRKLYARIHVNIE